MASSGAHAFQNRTTCGFFRRSLLWRRLLFSRISSTCWLPRSPHTCRRSSRSTSSTATFGIAHPMTNRISAQPATSRYSSPISNSAANGNATAQSRCPTPRCPRCVNFPSMAGRTKSTVSRPAYCPKKFRCSRSVSTPDIDREVRNGIPRVADAEENEEHRTPGKREQRLMRKCGKRNCSGEHHSISDERRECVPQPIVESRLVDGCFSHAPHDARRIKYAVRPHEREHYSGSGV